jgi:indole-3-glycerol phosphate synthase
MENILEKIYQHKLIEVRNCKKELDLKQICKQLKCQDQSNDSINFLEALQQKTQKKQTALICEIKKASPSKGIIRNDFDVSKIAKIYQQHQATCLSVLTDQKFFLGSNQDLIEARKSSNLPILRKDFMVDGYQIYQAKLLQANCILLIVAMLDDQKLQELEQIAIDLNLSVLIEVHNQQELQRASKLQSKLIGINNRNLKTMEVNINNSIELANQVDDSYTLVCESGIKSAEDLKLLKNHGFNCFLIGEYFMSKSDIGLAIDQLLEIN